MLGLSIPVLFILAFYAVFSIRAEKNPDDHPK